MVQSLVVMYSYLMGLKVLKKLLLTSMKIIPMNWIIITKPICEEIEEWYLLVHSMEMQLMVASTFLTVPLTVEVKKNNVLHVEELEVMQVANKVHLVELVG